jgi:general secretion pathway protein E
MDAVAENFTTERVSTPSAKVRQKLGEVLVERGKIDPAELDRVLKLQATSATREKIGSLLSTLGVVSAREVALALAQQSGLPYVETSAFPEIPILEERISARFLRDARALPIEETESTLTLAVADPYDAFTQRSFELVTNRKVVRLIAVGSEIDSAIERLYGSGRTQVAQLSDGNLDAQFEGEAVGADVQQLKDLASEAPVIRLVSLIITNALEACAIASTVCCTRLNRRRNASPQP